MSDLVALDTLALQQSTANMDRLSNTDMHMAHRFVNGNAGMAGRLYEMRLLNWYLPEHRMLISLHQVLGDNVSVRTWIAAGHLGRTRTGDMQDILQHFRENPRTSIPAAAKRLRIANYSEVWRVLRDYLANSSQVGSSGRKLQDIFRSVCISQTKLILRVIVCSTHTTYICGRATTLM